MFVLGLKKNLVSASILEDHVYDVIFNKGKVFLRHISMGQVKQIGVRFKNLYALEVEDACKAFRSKVVVSDLVFGREKLSLNMHHQN